MIPTFVLRSGTTIAALSLAGLLASNAIGAGTYRLGPSDVVRVTVYNNPDLSTEAQLDSLGRIVFPLIGPVELAGLEKGQAESRIASALGSYVKMPQVNVMVSQFRSRQVSILGQVNKPGYYYLESLTRLADVLALAGGISATGSERVTIVKNGAPGQYKRFHVDADHMLTAGNLADNVEIGNGDVIYVPRAPVFYIYGEVQRAGAYRLASGMTVMQAISLGGSLTPRGSQQRVLLNRPGKDGKVEELETKLTDLLQENDVVYVKEALF